MVYASVSDVEVRWRPLSADEKVKAEVLLGDAAVYIDSEYPPTGLTAQDLHARKIVSVNLVKRAMSSPAGVDVIGVNSIQQGAGPYQQTLGFASPSGDMYMTKQDRLLLSCGGGLVFTVPLSNDATFVAPWDDGDVS